MMAAMKTIRCIGLWLFCFSVILLGSLAVAEVGTSTLVVCAPGYPGSTAEAQSAMDDLASALAVQAGMKSEALGAVYFEDETDGVAGLGQENAALALVTLPFFLEHRKELSLQPVAQAVQFERMANEPWTLVAGAGRIMAPGDLAGWEIMSLGGHSPAFVRGTVFDGWGEVPDDIDIVFSSRVLTALRRAAKGENVAVLLDGEQAAALDRLPFADDLVVVRTTEPAPTSLLCSVGDRLSTESSAGLIDAAMGLGDTEAAADALAAVRIDRFVVLDTDALDRVTGAFDRANE